MTGRDIQGQMYRDKGIGTRKREMEGNKGRNRDRVTGTDVQGQRDRDKEEGDEQGQRNSELGTSIRTAKCTGTERMTETTTDGQGL